MKERPSFSFEAQYITWWPLITFALWTSVLCGLALGRLAHAIDLDRAPRMLPVAAVS